MPPLFIEHPDGYVAERHYIFDVFLNEFLGLEFCAQVTDRCDTRISVPGEKQQLLVAEGLFQTPPEQWLSEKSCPQRPLRRWKNPGATLGIEILSPQLPILFGGENKGTDFCETNGQSLILALDLFGGAFFMLTRYEEIAQPQRDDRDRFPATASLAFAEGFLNSPIVNEYLEILWAALKQLWPRLRRRPRAHRVLLSHDVDRPLSVTGAKWSRVLKNSAADAVRRKDVFLAARRLRAYRQSWRGEFDGDPNNTFDFMMNISEEYGLKSAFFFIAGHSAGAIDGTYYLKDTWIRTLIRRIHVRGHEIGLHPSYNTYCDAGQTRREFANLMQTLDAEGVHQDHYGGRQHYLRWRNPATWQNWEDAGLSYDSTLSFADQIGFRCGTCYEYPVFNLQTRGRLKLRERPLIVMEQTLLEYMNLSWHDSQIALGRLNATCRRFGGDFTLLWHNGALISLQEQCWYRQIISEIAG